MVERVNSFHNTIENKHNPKKTEKNFANEDYVYIISEINQCETDRTSLVISIEIGSVTHFLYHGPTLLTVLVAGEPNFLQSYAFYLGQFHRITSTNLKQSRLDDPWMLATVSSDDYKKV